MAIGDTLTIGGVMPDAAVGVPYRVSPLVNGGYPPYRFDIDAPLPQGFSHSLESGEILGLPLSGTFGISGVNQKITDSTGQTATRAIVVNVTNRTGAATGFVIATISDPFAGQGVTTFSTSGTVPPQLALVSNQIVAGSQAPVAGQAYSITIVATNGGRTVTQTLTFVAVLTAGTQLLTGYDGQVLTGYDGQTLTGVAP